MSAHRPSLQRYFLSGVITLLPLWLTVIVFRFVFVLLSDVSRPWITPSRHFIAQAAMILERIAGRHQPP
ncbi:MAG TPA: hypothetical protein PLF73_02210, partial [Luteimonas sp.]|nr:hypothetical protein [Luteimonas sp.]